MVILNIVVPLHYDWGVERIFVWAGGAAFVSSLVYCGYAYGLAWSEGNPVRQISWPAVIVNTLLFTAFAAHHSLFAREGVKAWLARTVPERLGRSVYVWVASLLLIGLLAAWQHVGGTLYRVTGAGAVALAAVQITGVWLIAQSVRAIDGLALAGIRPVAPSEALQLRGPYYLVRHPLYLGWMLIVFGAAHMTGNRLAFATITSIYLIVAIPWEERSLERAFGRDYAQYRSLVRWRVLPFVY